MPSSPVQLRRTVRFAVGHVPPDADQDRNGFGGRPGVHGIARYIELEVACLAPVDPQTGYSLNIKVIDQAVRRTCLGVFEQACAGALSIEPVQVLARVLAPLNAELGGVLHSVTWRLSPQYSVEMPMDQKPASPLSRGTPGRVLLRQQFEFAAAHRLHVPELSEQENRAIFGKCNNPRGHGHNYKVEPCVEVLLDSDARPRFTLKDLERLTMSSVIDRFDHTHLNEDTEEFASGRGLNPSVENIAKVCFELLSASIAKDGGGRSGATLRSITVWETDKTCCTYPAPGAAP